MNKQDRQGVRTAADLERKYDFGKIMDAASEAQKMATDIEERVTNLEKNGGGGGGGTGENGATFTPFVSSAGVISWTNDKGLANPTPVNIKGPQGATGAKGDKGDKGDTGAQGIQGEAGEDGYTPVKGEDYWTEEDKQEIKQEILDMDFGSGDMRQDTYDPDGWVEEAGGIPAYVDDMLAGFEGGVSAEELDKKLDKTGGTLTGDLNVGSADINVENGNIGVSDLFFDSTAINAGNIKISTGSGTVTLSPIDGLTFEDTEGNKKTIGGIGYITDPDPNAVMFSEMEEYVEEAIQSIETDETLIYKDGKLSVNTVSEVEADNTLPITSAAVNTTVGNIEVLLKTI